MISLIAAMAKNRVIGNNNAMPWYLPEDFKHFKAVTMGKPIVMGRKTLQSIGKPLPGRKNIVISRDKNFITPKDVLLVASIEEAIHACDNADEIMIIGGANIYQQTISMADKIYLTLIDKEFDGDTFFPALDTDIWQEKTRETFTKENQFTYHFLTLSKK